MALVSEDENPWYIDSGCSGTREHLEDFKSLKGGRVTFGDGSQGGIKGRWKTIDSRPPLNKVYIVNGLNANLISISQLCNEGLMVQSTSKDCKALNDENKAVFHGVRSGNNGYIWQKEHQCFIAHNEMNLWHQRLGHMNSRHMTDLVRKGMVRGIPPL